MHFSLLAVNFNEQDMEIYNEFNRKEEYKVYLTLEDIKDIKKYYKISDEKGILEKINDYYGEGQGTKDEKGIYYYSTINDDGRRDWYEIGGRWSDYLIVKKGDIKVSEAHKKDIDFKSMKYSQEIKFKKLYKEGKLKENRLKVLTDLYLNRHYDIKKGETLPQYLERKIDISTCSILTKEGEWIESKGLSGNKEKEEWKNIFMETINNLEDDDYLTIIDYHC